MKIIVLIFVLLISGCKTTDIMIVEPTFKRTFAPIVELKAGKKINIFVHKLNENEQLRFQLCGPQCNTATEVQVVNAGEFSGKEVIFIAPMDGEYYFWIKNTIITGSGAAVTVVADQVTSKGHILEFSSGTKITVYK